MRREILLVTILGLLFVMSSLSLAGKIDLSADDTFILPKQRAREIKRRDCVWCIGWKKFNPPS